MNRIVFIGASPSTISWATWSSRQLLFLEAEDPDQDINLYINSPAASFRGARDLRHHCSFMARHDVAHHTAWARRRAWRRLLLAAGAPGKRSACRIRGS